VAIDVVAPEAGPRTWGTRAMESRWLASIYDRIWRPVSFALSTGFGVPSRKVEADAVVAELGRRDGPWLDLSCGPGWLTRRLVDEAHREGRGRDVFAVDRSRPMLERARREAPSAVLVRADAASLPFADGAFAAVVNLAALDLYLDPEGVVRESARVLAVGGRWVCSSFVAASPPGRRSKRGALSGVCTPTLDEMADWVRRAGLTGFDNRSFRGYVVAWADKG
jgi:ubiquinone/menaquinone biosynthesis C-methylase UbiE